MKKLLLVLTLLAVKTVSAQPDGRVFTISNSSYASLVSPNIITTPGWDDFDAYVPLSFNFSMWGTATDTVYFDSEFNTGFDLSFDSFVLGPTHLIGMNTDYIDRGDIDPSEISYVGYKIDVVNGKKIAKIEGKNLGFYSGNNDDSTNFQLWLYEGSNDIEVHWGASHVTGNFIDIFPFQLPFFSIWKNIDVYNENLERIYYVSALSPSKMDSLDMTGLMSASTLGTPTYPANGMVYKFSYPTTGVKGVELNNYTTVYPTLFSDQLYVDIHQNHFSGVVSLIDAVGKVVSQQRIVNGKNVISTDALAPGNYVININSGKESVFYKIVKQ